MEVNVTEDKPYRLFSENSFNLTKRIPLTNQKLRKYLGAKISMVKGCCYSKPRLKISKIYISTQKHGRIK